MVRKGDIHIFTEPPPQHPLGGFDDVGADVQIFAGNILHQLHQSVALAGIPQGVDLFHPGGGQKISGRFFEPDAQPTQNNFLTAGVLGADEIAADHPHNFVGAVLFHGGGHT